MYVHVSFPLHLGYLKREIGINVLCLFLGWVDGSFFFLLEYQNLKIAGCLVELHEIPTVWREREGCAGLVNQKYIYRSSLLRQNKRKP